MESPTRPHSETLSADAELATRVRDFVEQEIHSVDELEALLLVHSAKRWGVAEAARRLYIDEPYRRDRSRLLVARGEEQGQHFVVR